MPGAAALAVLSLAFGLRAYHLADANLWFDEGFSHWVALSGPLVAAERTLHDTHPPLYYWLLWGWSLPAGDTPFALRYLSAAAGTLAVALGLALGRRLGGWPLGLTLAVLLGTHRFAIDWSQQIRMYAPALGLVMAVWYFWWRTGGADDRAPNVPVGPRASPIRAGRFFPSSPFTLHSFAYAVAVALLGYTLYLGLMVPTVLAFVTVIAALGGWLPRPDWRGWAAAHGLAVALLLPWGLLVAVAGSRPRLTSISQPGLGAYLEAAGAALTLGVLGDIGRVKVVAAALLVGAGLGVALAGWRRGRRAAALAAAAGLIVPVGGLYLLSLPNPLLYLPNLFVRYLVVFLPAYLLGLGWALVPAGRRRIWIAAPVALLVIGATGWTLRDYYQGRYLTDEYQSIARLIEAYQRPDDQIVLYSDQEFPVFQAVYRGGLPIRRIGTEVALTPESAAGQGAAALAGHRSAWVVTVDEGRAGDPAGHFRTWLTKNTRDLLHLQVANRSVNLYTVAADERRTAVEQLAPEHPLAAPLSPEWELIGYDRPLDRVARGDALRLGVYLRATRPSETVPEVELDLLDGAGRRFRSARRPLVGSWFAPFATGQVILGHLETRIVDGIPGGRYRATLRLIGDAAAGSVDLGTVAILSDRGLSAQPEPPVPIDRPAAEGIRLAGRGRLDEVIPGRPATIELYWAADEATPLDLQAYVRLIGLDRGPAPGDPLWAARYQPAPGGRSTPTWVPGLVVVDPVSLDVPAGLPSGRYRLEAGLFDPAGKADQGPPVTLWEGIVAGTG